MKTLKLFRYVIIKGFHHYPLDTWYNMEKTTIKFAIQNAKIQNMFKNNDKNIEWYMEFREVIF